MGLNVYVNSYTHNRVKRLHEWRSADHVYSWFCARLKAKKFTWCSISEPEPPLLVDHTDLDALDVASVYAWDKAFVRKARKALDAGQSLIFYASR